MCQRPSWVYVKEAPVPTKQMIACRQCWQCKLNYVNDFVGRGLCEASLSDWVTTLTLTYRPRDDLAEKIITPSHFQQFIRNLRDRNYNLRYLVAGEYGKLKGRAHFHVILFGQGKRLQLPQKQYVDDPDIWLHGNVYADHTGDEKAIRYVCKYILKDNSEQSWKSMSKYPPLGHEWFMARAERMADLGVFPRTFTYLPPGGNRDREYLMTGTTKANFLKRTLELWLTKREIRPEQLSEWVRNAVDKADFRERVAWAEARPLLDQINELAERLEQTRPTERQINRVFLDTQHDGKDDLGKRTL